MNKMKQPPKKNAITANKLSSPIRLQAPLHSVFVHFTIALTAFSLIFDGLGRLLNNSSLGDAGFWTMASAAFITPATLLSGAVSAAKVPLEEGEARSFLRFHMVLGFVFYGLLVALAVWRLLFWQDATVVSFWYLAALVVAVVMMALQGYLGGELVYRHGVSVKGSYSRLPVERKDISTPCIFPARKTPHTKTL
jgi:uncharacterized membrane protein